MTATSHGQGSSFGNAINYIYEGKLAEHKDKKEELILHSDSIRVPRDAADLKGRNRMKSDFISQAAAHQQRGNEQRKHYVGHHSLNFSASDMEGLSPQRIAQITEDYIKDAGIDQTQYVAVSHGDTAHYHIHIIFNRATDKQTLYNDWREHNKTAERAVALNLKYGFTQEQKQVKMASSPEVLAIRSGHSDIQNIRADTLIGRAKNLHHLSKICAIEGRFYGEENGRILVGEKQYRKEDLQAVFYDSRSEDRSNASQRHTEETTQRKQARAKKPKDYTLKASRRVERVTARAASDLAAQTKGTKGEKERTEYSAKDSINVSDDQVKATHDFSGLRTETLISAASEVSRSAEPSPSQVSVITDFGIGSMVVQSAGGKGKKLDGQEEEEKEAKKKQKKKGPRM